MERCADGQFLEAISKKIYRLLWILKITYAVMLIAAGFDKIFYKLLPWQIYVSPLVHTLLLIALGAWMVTQLQTLYIAIESYRVRLLYQEHEES